MTGKEVAARALDPRGRGGIAETSPSSLEEQLAAAREALAARDRLLLERSSRLARLEDASDRLAAAAARLESLTAELAALRLARREELAEQDQRIRALEVLLARAERAAEARRGGADDLQRIKGIGPVIEALLNGVGLTTFRQVAALAGDDLHRVGDLLGVFRGRIQRDRWLAQAAALAAAEPSPPGAQTG